MYCFMPANQSIHNNNNNNNDRFKAKASINLKYLQELHTG